MTHFKHMFVFQIRGTCFLFECGPSENFRCKFTEHTNYTSAILDLRRPLTPVTESVHPLSVHEVALNKLKRPTTTTTTTGPPSVQVLSKTTPASADKNGSLGGTISGCKRFEFQCHTAGNEGGCIGIYNVCDGIPQCEDSSDEVECPPEVVASNTKNLKVPEQRYGPQQVNEIGMKVLNFVIFVSKTL